MSSTMTSTSQVECKDCTKCLYKYCINEDFEPSEQKDRSEYFKKYQSKNRDEINQKHREAYRQKIKNGVCVRCDQKATNGLYCKKHSIQSKERSRERAAARKLIRQKEGTRTKRINESLCLWCGEKATGETMACDRHRKLFSISGQKGLANSAQVEMWHIRRERLKMKQKRIDYEGFRNYMREQELSENTINSYIYDLQEYEKIKGNDFSKDSITDYKWNRLKCRSGKTVNHYIASIKKYCKYIGVECDVKKVKVQKISAVENVITLEQFYRLIVYLRADGREKYAAYLLIPAKTGARISEALNFKKKDLDQGYAQIYTKGKVRTIYFPESLKEELGDTFKDLGDDDYLLQNRYAKKMTQRGFDQMFKRYAALYGIPKEVAHAHGLRHMFAKEFLKRNPNISLLADILGHSGVNTTMIYTRASKEEQISQLNNTVNW